MRKEPNFFIVGAPKCGTTSLAAWLAVHPQVYMSPVKEPYHFATDMGYTNFRDQKKYLSLFSDVPSEQTAVGEASAGYLYSRSAIKNILDNNSESKFIAIVRNPIEMAQSLHQQFVYDGDETILSFEQAWQAQEMRKKGMNIPKMTREPRFLLYFEACQLGSQIQKMYQMVNKHNRLILVLDDIRDNPRQEWLKIQQFLGIQDDQRIEFPTLNQAKKHKSQNLAKLFNLQLRAREFFRIPSFGTGILQKLNTHNIAKKKKVCSPSFHETLVKAFTDEIHLLEQLLYRDCSHWLTEHTDMEYSGTKE